MATPTNLRDDPAATLQHIVDIMYGDGPDQPWEADTIEHVAEVLQTAGLVPGWTKRRVVCEDALASLGTIRNQLRRVGAVKARQAVARAMKSVDGARRHAGRFE